MDTQPSSLTNCLLHSNSQLEEPDPTQAAEAEGDPEAAVAEVAVVLDNVRYLPQQSHSIKSYTVLEVMILMQLSFSPDLPQHV